jgi:hypothetical protein
MGRRRLPDRRRRRKREGHRRVHHLRGNQRGATRTRRCISYGLLGNHRNTSRRRVIDMFEMPLPVTADGRIEAALNEKGIGFADNAPWVTLYRGAPPNPGLRSAYGGEVIVNAVGAPGRRAGLSHRPSVGCLVEMLAIPLPPGKFRKKSHRSPAKIQNTQSVRCSYLKEGVHFSYEDYWFLSYNY